MTENKKKLADIQATIQRHAVALSLLKLKMKKRTTEEKKDIRNNENDDSSR